MHHTGWMSYYDRIITSWNFLCSSVDDFDSTCSSRGFVLNLILFIKLWTEQKKMLLIYVRMSPHHETPRQRIKAWPERLKRLMLLGHRARMIQWIITAQRYEVHGTWTTWTMVMEKEKRDTRKWVDLIGRGLKFSSWSAYKFKVWEHKQKRDQQIGICI